MMKRSRRQCIGLLGSSMIMVGSLVLGASPSNALLVSFDTPGPSGSESFANVTVLPNGNVVAIDPYFDLGSVANVGAVRLYDGGTRALISTLTGSSADDLVGIGGVTVLSNGDFVVASYLWNSSTAVQVGAVTRVDSTTGLNGTVDASNSLVGSTDGDFVGVSGVVPLTNGNYVVVSSIWDNGSTTDVGAVTWADGTAGIVGDVSAANSLIGATAGDRIGQFNTKALANGNYVVGSTDWDNGAVVNAGAVTLGNGASGTVGIVSPSNSLVGSADSDGVGATTALPNGNAVALSSVWDNAGVFNAGAVTWINGSTGLSGPINSTNSLVGTRASNQIGAFGIWILTNGNYVVPSPYWDSASAVDVGAATWGSGTTGVVGEVSELNSLVGTVTGDQVGSSPVTVLANGNYAVVSPYWDSVLASNVGAVTWGNGTTGTVGFVGSANSLTGSTNNDLLSANSTGVQALANGNYVVPSPLWDRGSLLDAGAVTWLSGTGPTSAVVSATNSLVGTSAGDEVSGLTVLPGGDYIVNAPAWDNGPVADAGAVIRANGTTGTVGEFTVANSLAGTTTNNRLSGSGVTVLANGSYVIGSSEWDSATMQDVGAATWFAASASPSGTVSAANSLVGSAGSDFVGSLVTPLNDGNYVVASRYWDNGAVTNAGAMTWGNGSTGTSGTPSASNSLVGTTSGDFEFARVEALPLGRYVVHSPWWDNGASANAGAVTWSTGSTGVSGSIDSSNSVLGDAAGGGDSQTRQYSAAHGGWLIVGQPRDNLLTWVTLNTVPTVTPIGNLSLEPNASVGPIAITVGDREQPVAGLTVTATSSDQSIIADSSIVIAGSGATRTLAASAVPGGSGTVTLTVLVNDGELTSTTTFTVAVAAAPAPPTVPPATTVPGTAAPQTTSPNVTVPPIVTAPNVGVVPSGQLPATGTNLTLVWLALGLAASGAGAVAISRRRIV
jgi:LPXTG-motif cell wall-anchored protein